MKLYTSGKEDVELKSLRKIDEGSSAKIYRKGQTIYKVYFTTNPDRISPAVFKVLSNIRNKHFVELYDTISVAGNEVDSTKRKIDGYTCKYYKKNHINPFMEESSFLLQSIEDLQELYAEFTRVGIEAHDSHYENCIFTDNGAVIIDPDDYVRNNNEFDLRTKNAKQLYHLIRSFSFNYTPEDYETIVNMYFDRLKTLLPGDALNVFKKDIGRVRTPIQLFE